MKTTELFNAFANNPQAKYSTALYRSVDGILFRKYHDNEGTHWVPFIVVTESVLLFPRNHYRFLPERERWAADNALVRLKDTCVNGRVGVTYECDIARLPKWPSNRRVLVDRHGLIASIINASIYEDYASMEPEFVRRVWTLQWEYAITLCAKTVLESRNKTAISANKLASEPKLHTLMGDVESLRANVAADEFSTAVEAVTKIHRTLQFLSDATNTLRGDIGTAITRAKSLSLPSVSHISADGRHGTFSNPEYLRPLMLTNEDIIAGWEKFSFFLRQIGINVPDPFGLKFNYENVAKLAALYETSSSTIKQPEHYMRGDSEPSSANSNELLA